MKRQHIGMRLCQYISNTRSNHLSYQGMKIKTEHVVVKLILGRFDGRSPVRCGLMKVVGVMGSGGGGLVIR